MATSTNPPDGYNHSKVVMTSPVASATYTLPSWVKDISQSKILPQHVFRTSMLELLIKIRIAIPDLLTFISAFSPCYRRPGHLPGPISTQGSRILIGWLEAKETFPPFPVCLHTCVPHVRLLRWLGTGIILHLNLIWHIWSSEPTISTEYIFRLDIQRFLARVGNALQITPKPFRKS